MKMPESGAKASGVKLGVTRVIWLYTPPLDFTPGRIGRGLPRICINTCVRTVI